MGAWRMRRSIVGVSLLLVALGALPARAAPPVESQAQTQEARTVDTTAAEATQQVLFPTAFTTPKGQSTISIVGVAPWDFLYGVTSHLEVGVRTTPPAGAFIFAPQAKMSWPFRGGAFAVHAQAGLFLPYLLDTNGLGYAGGGPIVTIGSPRRYFTVGAEAYAVFTDKFSMAVLLPYMGGFVHLGRRISVGAELVLPATWPERTWSLPFGEQALIMYGVRILGERMWGNILFAAPICESCGILYEKGLVFGIPLLGVGLAF
jgi:hypothetical protein